MPVEKKPAGNREWEPVKNCLQLFLTGQSVHVGPAAGLNVGKHKKKRLKEGKGRVYDEVWVDKKERGVLGGREHDLRKGARSSSRP